MNYHSLAVRCAGPALAVLSVTIVLLLVEAGLRLALPAADSYRALRPGMEVELHPHPEWIPGVQGPALFRVNSMGLRGREWGVDRAQEFRVLCLGGSTTESLYNDQRRSWPARTELELGDMADGRAAWVGSAGRSGQSSEHHVLQMEHLPPVYDPDLVVILAGVNDFVGLLRDDANYDPTRAETDEGRRQLMDRAFAERPGTYGPAWVDDPWWKRTRTWTLLRMGRELVEGHGEHQDPQGRNLVAWRAAREQGRMRATLPVLSAGLERYRHNLLKIVRLGRSHGLALAFVSQPTLWRDDLSDAEEALLWMGGVGDFRRNTGSFYYEPGALARGMEEYNDVLREVCAREGLLCVDLAAMVPKTTEHFFDDCHLTDRGQELVAEVLARAIREGLDTGQSGPTGP